MFPLKPIWHIFLCPVICDSSVVVQNRKLQNAMCAISPWQFHGIDGIVSFQVLCGTPIVAPYHILLTIGPTCRHGEENHSYVARNASDQPQYQAPLIHNHTPFKCFIASSNIITSCYMLPCILWYLIICQSEHRTFAFRLAIDAHWSVTN